MNVIYGIVDQYDRRRGTGYVKTLFPNDDRKSSFFKIGVVRRSNRDVANSLNRRCHPAGIYFWYTLDYIPIGSHTLSCVHSVITNDRVRDCIGEDIGDYALKLEKMWRNRKAIKPTWLYEVTAIIMGNDRAEELQAKRDRLDKRQEAKERKEREAYTRWQEESLRHYLESKKNQETIEEQEFRQLVEEMTPLGFSHSNQVSWYIIENNLGYRYRHISGVVKMEQDGELWDFAGGFPPNIYARLCIALGLSNQNSNARVVGFDSSNDLDGESEN